MAITLATLPLSKKIPNWVNLISRISSLSCTNHVEFFPENNQNQNTPPNSSEFEANIQFLRNKLYPDSLIQVLDSTSDLNSAVKIFKWASLQKRFRHDANTYFQIILKLGLAGNLVEMDNFCQILVKDGCKGVEQALNSLIDAFVAHRKLNEAIQVLMHMNSGGCRQSIGVFNLVLCALVEEKRGFQDILFVYKEMVKVGIAPTIDTLNYLLDGLFKNDKIETALDQYRRMSKKGCSPNSRTFEILLKGLLAKNRVDEAVVYLGNMLELGCKLDMSFYTCIIPLFCRQNKPEDGLRLFRMMRASNFVPESRIYEDLIQCLCENLQLDDANNLFEEMIENGALPGDDVFVGIVNGFCRTGKMNEAIRFLEDKHVSKTSPHNALLEGCCNTGNFFVAKDLLLKMSERNIDDCYSWNILIRWLCENVGVRKAFEPLGRMIISSLVPDPATYSAFVVGFCRLSKYEDALELFHKVCAKCWALDSMSYCELIEGLCQSGRIAEAAEVFRCMSRNRCSLPPSSFNTLIKSICDMGKVDEAIRLRLLAYNSRTSWNNETYSTVMLGLSQLGKAKALLVVLSQMLVEGFTLDVETYHILICSMTLQNRAKDCAFFFNLMVNEGFVPDSETLFNLLLCLANHSELCRISSTIDKLVSNYEILNSAMYNILINGLWKEGCKDEASRLLDLMLEKGWVPDATTHGLLIGSAVREETDGITWEYENFSDNVSNLLAEGLEKW